jgi:hypothetical protein
MKLLAAGLALIATGLALVAFTDLDLAALFIAGAVCTFLGVINLLSLSYGLGAGAETSDTRDAVDLVNANNRASRGFSDHI